LVKIGTFNDIQSLVHLRNAFTFLDSENFFELKDGKDRQCRLGQGEV